MCSKSRRNSWQTAAVASRSIFSVDVRQSEPKIIQGQTSDKAKHGWWQLPPLKARISNLLPTCSTLCVPKKPALGKKNIAYGKIGLKVLKLQNT